MTQYQPKSKFESLKIVFVFRVDFRILFRGAKKFAPLPQTTEEKKLKLIKIMGPKA